MVFIALQIAQSPLMFASALWFECVSTVYRSIGQILKPFEYSIGFQVSDFSARKKIQI
jgi:hypothetical protein